MKPTKTDEDALVDLLDVVLEEGVVLQADVIVSVADIPLIGIQLRAAIAGMATMTEYGFFEEWDVRHRRSVGSGDAPATSRRTQRLDREEVEVGSGNGDRDGDAGD